METKAVEIRSSRVSGKGVYALRSLRKGEVVLEWDRGNLIQKANIQSVSGNDKYYLVPFDELNYLLLSEPERYVNHSCEPNTKVVNFSDVATRNIGEGEEITSDYETEGDSQYAFTCNCGTANCRGKIRSKYDSEL